MNYFKKIIQPRTKLKRTVLGGSMLLALVGFDTVLAKSQVALQDVHDKRKQDERFRAEDGYPVTNFALTVNASPSGELFGRILQNTGQLGGWLMERGSMKLAIEKQGTVSTLGEFSDKDVERRFPFVSNRYKDQTKIYSELALRAFSPLGVNDAHTSSLPVLMVEVDVKNDSESSDVFNLLITPDFLSDQFVQRFSIGDHAGIGNEDFQISSDLEGEWQEGSLKIPINVPRFTSKKLRIVLSFYDPTWVSATTFSDVKELTQYAYKNWEALASKTEAFDQAIPSSGDAELDEYVRWYTVPAVSLTRISNRNEVLTMGYQEFNQRDSYWTSFLHLVLYRDLERTMIEESISFQQPSGKIPTTILPLIEREDDIDINAFFILRASRYYKYHKSKEELKAHWPALEKAMDWLISRDTEGNGLPVQKSFWGDWKDVKGVEGRKYSPFSGLIYLAALKEMQFLGKELKNASLVSKYADYYHKGYTFINKNIEDGGLWNGKYYCQIWNDGSVNDHLLQDQTIGILFDVVPKDRSAKIFDELNAKSLTDYGIAETFPYYPESWGYKPATYHNGAVWPWLSFMDCWARVKEGRTKEAIDLVKRVAKADLVESGDWSPNEHINSLTGENLGFHLQGWNAGLFGLVYFGLLHPDTLP